MRGDYRILDADCHQMEPPNLWQEYIDPAFRDRAPARAKVDGRTAMMVDAYRLRLASLYFSGFSAYRLRSAALHFSGFAACHLREAALYFSGFAAYRLRSAALYFSGFAA